ncbi:hypothetical protein PI126_g15998 [Phytophthora idaei]|nr:hypothetical protein PI126_g15998 [Phytophthora idaei]
MRWRFECVESGHGRPSFHGMGTKANDKNEIEVAHKQMAHLGRNRQLDNTWETLRKYNHLVHANRSLQTDGIKAVLLKSFGFGQVSGELLVVHPDYLLSTLSVEDFQQSMVGASGAVMSTMMSRSGTSAPCQGVASV